MVCYYLNKTCFGAFFHLADRSIMKSLKVEVSKVQTRNTRQFFIMRKINYCNSVPADTIISLITGNFKSKGGSFQKIIYVPFTIMDCVCNPHCNILFAAGKLG